jgi:hypothetical protein
VFDILNIFRRRWFLSLDSLRAQALSAQKAEDGKIFWVKFAPQFHAHLVKCAVALVPWPIQKVKKVMFVYILELLNGDSHLAFFDLQKGDRRATTAQKEKKRLARQRNRTSRWDRQKLAKAKVDTAKEDPQWKCEACGRKFASRKTAKRHRCPHAKGAVRGARTVADKGKTVVRPEPNLPGSSQPPPPPAPTAPKASTS